VVHFLLPLIPVFEFCPLFPVHAVYSAHPIILRLIILITLSAGSKL
jgi:hypothetical protein